VTAERQRAFRTGKDCVYVRVCVCVCTCLPVYMHVDVWTSAHLCEHFSAYACRSVFSCPTWNSSTTVANRSGPAEQNTGTFCAIFVFAVFELFTISLLVVTSGDASALCLYGHDHFICVY
jgi:hypothetical protein